VNFYLIDKVLGSYQVIVRDSILEYFRKMNLPMLSHIDGSYWCLNKSSDWIIT